MSFFEIFKKLTIIFNINEKVWTYSTWFIFFLCLQTQIDFCIFWEGARGRHLIILPSYVCLLGFASPLTFLDFYFLFVLTVGTICFDVSLLTTTKTGILIRVKIIWIFATIPFRGVILVLFFFKNLLNFLDSRLKVSSSLDSWHLLWLAVFRAMLKTCLSLFSWINNLFISNPCSLNFPNNISNYVFSFSLYFVFFVKSFNTFFDLIYRNSGSFWMLFMWLQTHTKKFGIYDYW